MARYTLDEIESDEVYHALAARKLDLDKLAKTLEERDGLPEAAQQVRNRIALYMPNGEGRDTRPGLIRLFAPQRDIEAEAQANRDERSPDGQQDAFGGGAATGGGHPAGEVVPGGAAPKKSRKRKGSAAVAGDAGEGASSESPGEVTDVDFEVIPEARRLVSASTPTLANLPPDGLDALDRLESIAANLLDGPPTITPADFDAEAVRVFELLPKVNPGLDLDYAGEVFNGEFRNSDGNAHSIAFFVKRQTDAIRNEPAPANEAPATEAPADPADVPIDEAPAGLSFATPATVEL